MEVPKSRKRIRSSTGPRKRTGCFGCKASHVKCSETKPACERCIRTETTCIYPGPAISPQNRRRRDPSQLLFRKPLTPNSSSLTIASSNANRASTSLGYQALEYFHQHTVPMIAHFVPSKFWTETLLQMSESIPAIKHCILALGSWHLALERPGDTVTSALISSSTDTLSFSAESYNQAISNLTKNISFETPTSLRVEVATAASLLLAIYSSLRGDRMQLITHVRLGLTLARQSSVSSCLTSVAEFNRRQLALLRLEEEMRAPIFDSISAEDTLADVLTDTTDIEEGLGNVSPDNLAAGVQNMGNAAYRFARKCNAMLHTAKNPAVVSEREELLRRCDDLRCQILNVCQSSNDTLDIKILRARLELSWVILQAGWTLVQYSFDQYTSSFALILQLAEEVLKPESSRQRRLPFSVNLGLIPLLFYVSRLCREPRLRRKAVDLLDLCPTIEGLWNAKEAAAVARFVIAFEEADVEQESIVGEPGDRNLPDERQRIHSLRFSRSDSQDMLDLTIMTRPETTAVGFDESHFHVSCEEWASGRSDICSATET